MRDEPGPGPEPSNEDRRIVPGVVVAVLDARASRRGVVLTEPSMRPVEEHSVHEIMLCDEADVTAGGVVDAVAYLGFVEIGIGGVIAAGDMLVVGGTSLGIVLGFDETHAPNHLNIVVVNHGRPETGRGLALELETPVAFRPPSSEGQAPW